MKHLIVNPSVQNNFYTLLSKSAQGCDKALLSHLADLFEKMMMLDPDKRISLDEAIRHPFVRTYVHRAKNLQTQKIQQAREAQRKAAEAVAAKKKIKTLP